MTDDQDIQDLREQTETTSRAEQTPTSSPTLGNAIVEALQEIDNGDRAKTIAVRDQPIAALLTALEEHDDRRIEVGQTLQEALERDVSGEFDRSQLVRLAVRVGLQEAADDVYEELADAQAEHVKQSM